MGRRSTLLLLAALLACGRHVGGGRSIDPPAGRASFGPRLSGSHERIVLSWVEPDDKGIPTLRFSRRNGGAWAPPRTVTQNAALAADRADVPSVVPLSDGGLAAAWTVKRGASAEARNLMVSVSHDDGATWNAPVRPHRDDTDSEHGMATLLPAASGGGFGVCWLDGRAGALAEYGEGGTALYWADWDRDGFAPEVLLDPRVCDCCKTSAASPASGPIVAYRDRGPAGDERRDIALIARAPAGWSKPATVHDDGWVLTACPTNGPAVVAQGDRTAVAWFTGANATPSVWLAFSGDGRDTSAAPLRVDEGAPVGRVDAAMLDDGSSAIVWLERKGQNAEVRVRRVSLDGRAMASVVVATTSPSRASGYPAVAAGSGNDVIVAWTETGAISRVRASVVRLP